MSKTVQVRDIDDETYAALRRHAAATGVSVPELVKRELKRIAARPTPEEWLARTRSRETRIETAEVLEALDEMRGTWPDAGR